VAGGGTAEGLTYLCELWTHGEAAVEAYYIALIRTIEPGFTTTGDELDEPESSGYERAEIINDSANWQIADTTLSNVNEVAFDPADDEWGRITYWAICDAIEGGRCLFVGQLENPMYLIEGAEVLLTPGAIWINMSGTQWAMASF
jgi:hypothetical protein